MPGGRPATPMRSEDDDVGDGALSLDDGAAFLGVSRRLLEVILARGELDVVYEGRKPRVLKGQLKARLRAQLDETRRTRAHTGGEG